MVVGLLGNESPDSNRLTLVTPKPENGVRLQATLDNQNPTGLPVGAVSVTGASDDLVELEGAITDEGDCWEGGEICVHAVSGGRIVDSCTGSNTFCFDVKWCQDEDVNGEVIPWTYHVPVEHAHFMVYENGKPYCRGFVFKVADAH